MKSEISEPDTLAQWELSRRFTWKDALAFISFYVFVMGPWLFAFWMVCLRFGVVNGMPLRDQIYGTVAWIFWIEAVVCTTLCAIVGKYLWLLAMPRFLGKDNVGPLVAYGIPRRISRLDRAIINRLYR